MAVRFRKVSSATIGIDHNSLLNKGTRTHAEIDSYLAELDAVRGSNPDINARIVAIESKNNEQDNRISVVENKNVEQDTRINAVISKNTEQDNRLTAIENDLFTKGNKDVEQDTRLSNLENSAGTNQEVIDARTDKDGIIFPNLKSRLDDMQSKIGSGGGGGAVVRQVTKLDVTATQDIPEVVDIEIPSTTDFKVPSVNVLKFIPSQEDKITVQNEFTSAEASDFTFPDGVIFDGTMRLQTEFVFDMVSEPIDSGSLFSLTIDKSLYKKIEGVVIS